MIKYKILLNYLLLYLSFYYLIKNYLSIMLFQFKFKIIMTYHLLKLKLLLYFHLPFILCLFFKSNFQKTENLK